MKRIILGLLLLFFNAGCSMTNTYRRPEVVQKISLDAGISRVITDDGTAETSSLIVRVPYMRLKEIRIQGSLSLTGDRLVGLSCGIKDKKDERLFLDYELGYIGSDSAWTYLTVAGIVIDSSTIDTRLYRGVGVGLGYYEDGSDYSIPIIPFSIVFIGYESERILIEIELNMVVPSIGFSYKI